MLPQKNFIRVAAVCCFLSVITTVGIHLFFPEPPADFESRVSLYKNPLYLLNRWWVIAHCLFVLVAMWGVALVQFRKAAGVMGLGFLFFSVFAIAEITRQMFVLFYMNGLREQYMAAPDLATRANLRHLLSYAGLLTAPFFGVFILTFALGNLCYGAGLRRETGLGKWVSVLLLLWAAEGLIALGNHFWKFEAINKFVEVYSYSFQPLIRSLLGAWLWKKAASVETRELLLK